MTSDQDERIETLAIAAARGDRDAFAQVMRLMMNGVYAYTYRMTGDRETAKDLTQETFVSAWEHLSGWRQEAKFSTWLYRIATNKALSAIEKGRRDVPLDKAVPAESLIARETADRPMHQERLRRQVLAFMASLPEQQRVVFDLRFYKQMQFGEIALATGKAVGTVKTLYREAVKKLRQTAVEKGWR